jgi:hypothetical protein
MPKQREEIPEGIEPVEMVRGQELKPNTIQSGKRFRIKPPAKKAKDVYVQNDWFVRRNILSQDEVDALPEDKQYMVDQYIQGQNPETGELAIVENPEYDGAQDLMGTLKLQPMSKGPKVGSNGQLLPARYPVKGKAPAGTQQEPREHTNVLIRQDN